MLVAVRWISTLLCAMVGAEIILHRNEYYVKRFLTKSPAAFGPMVFAHATNCTLFTEELWNQVTTIDIKLEMALLKHGAGNIAYLFPYKNNVGLLERNFSTEWSSSVYSYDGKTIFFMGNLGTYVKTIAHYDVEDIFYYSTFEGHIYKNKLINGNFDLSKAEELVMIEGADVLSIHKGSLFFTTYNRMIRMNFKTNKTSNVIETVKRFPHVRSIVHDTFDNIYLCHDRGVWMVTRGSYIMVNTTPECHAIFFPNTISFYYDNGEDFSVYQTTPPPTTQKGENTTTAKAPTTTVVIVTTTEEGHTTQRVTKPRRDFHRQNPDKISKYFLSLILGACLLVFVFMFLVVALIGRGNRPWALLFRRRRQR